MSELLSTSRQANVIARAIHRAFDQFQGEFRRITLRANLHFARQDWREMQEDSARRLDVYAKTIDQIVARIHQSLGKRVRSRLVWVSIKAVYSGLIDERNDWEIAETFFNSVTRRIFSTVGVDEEIEFVHSDYESPAVASRHAVYRTYEVDRPFKDLSRRILAANDLAVGVENIDWESSMVAAELRRRLRPSGAWAAMRRIEMAKPAFYRGEHAYLVGRIVSGDELIPLVFCLHHAGLGVYIDAVLTEESDVSLLFSFARSYFHVDVERPFELVRFIKSIIPRKPTAEIYISIGYNKHGKTELYRHALRHLSNSTDRYQLAAGQRGMVMVVFTMPSYPVVFKIIKDEFDYPKETTRDAVIDRYRLVFAHDRAGRLIDAQQYQYLTLDRRRFDHDLLDELLEVASQTVFVTGDQVVIRHCYAERRVTPLNLYLQQADEQAARVAAIDYGQAIKDLALTNIFPGDLMLKNFGVTRQRRLIFYDYDEVCLLTDCEFRKLPQSDDYDEEMAAEPWYAVGKHDVFPEEFGYFLGLAEPLRRAFLDRHSEILTVEYWQGVQNRLRAGELFHVAPYGEEKRIHRTSPAPKRRPRPVSVRLRNAPVVRPR